MKKFIFIMVVVFLSCFFKIASAALYDVLDEAAVTATNGTNKLLDTGGVLDGDLIKQYNELQTQTDHMRQVIEKLDHLNSREVSTYLNEINKLTNQSNSIMKELEDKTKYEDFGTNQRASYGKFYDDNTDKTMDVLKNSSDTIQKNVDGNSPNTVSDILDKARTDVNSDSYIKSMTALADINAEIVKELQSMQVQLIAIAQSQNAVAAKKIQEEAAKKQEFDLIIETSAVHKDILPHPLEDPVF